jgi:short-subunit dehydrogenase
VATPPVPDESVPHPGVPAPGVPAPGVPEPAVPEPADGPTGRPVAVVTGATAGIGAAFARELAAQGYDLILVARGADRLAATAAELSARHGIAARPLPADLTTDAGCALVEARLADGVELLVNNAGHSLHTAFVKATVAQEEQLLALNVHAVMRLTKAAVVPMMARRHGAVVNVSSASAFAAVMPGSTYPASKAWVNAFTESVALSVRPYGVRLLTLCPGYTRTEFHDRQGIDTGKIPGFLWLDADDVVRAALRDLRKGKLVSIPDWRYKTAVFAMRHAPRALVHRAARDGRGRIGQ